MGFLKFLKKGKKEKVLDESLDVPPLPPSMKGKMPVGKFKGAQLPKEDFPQFKFHEERPMHPKAKFHDLYTEEPELKIPDLPPLEEESKFVPKPPVKETPLPKKGLIKPEFKGPFEEEAEHDITEKKIPPSTVHPVRKHARKGPRYVSLSNFREMLGDITTLRKNLRRSDELLQNLFRSREEKDRDFEKWNNIMEDMQKKLIFIEKTLFKR